MIFRKALTVALALGLMVLVTSCRQKVLTLDDVMSREDLLEHECVIELSPGGHISIGSAPIGYAESSKRAEEILRSKALRDAKQRLIQSLFRPEPGNETQVKFVGGRIVREGFCDKSYRVAFFAENVDLEQP
jgi:hypothetical protein